MFELQISKDSYKFLCMLYEEYLTRRDSLSKDSAKRFYTIPDFICEHFDKSDCHSCLVELKANGFIKLYIDDGFLITDDAIVYMENRFKKGISDVADFISKIL